MDSFISLKDATQLLIDGVPSDVRKEFYSYTGFLEACCRDGHLDVTGTHPNTGNIVSISKVDWRHLLIDTLSGDTNFYTDIRDDTTLQGKSFTGLLWSDNQIRGIIPHFHNWLAREWLLAKNIERHKFSDEILKWLSSVAKTDLRSFLIRQEDDGFISSTEVEAVVARWKLGALSPKPCPSEYDPMAMAYWSIPMVIAWIVWRTPFSVSEQMDDFLVANADWQPKQYSVSIENLKLGETYDKVEGKEKGKAQSMSIDEARESLLHNLANGTVGANGYNADNKPVKIPEFEWVHLSFAEGENGADVVVNRKISLKPVYTDITLPQSEVVKAYKETIKPKEPKKSLILTGKQKRKIEAWYESDYVPSFTGSKSPTQKDDYQASKDKFGERHYGGTVFLADVRRKFAPPSWTKRGKKTKQK